MHIHVAVNRLHRWGAKHSDTVANRMHKIIEQKLKPIEGRPVWAVGRAARMLWIQIGDRHTVNAWGGGTKEVGTFALHVDCPWSWTQFEEVIADHDSGLEHLYKLLAMPVICQTISAENNGSFNLKFHNGSALVVSADADANANVNEDETEFWRFFMPSKDTSHFVVGSKGIQR